VKHHLIRQVVMAALLLGFLGGSYHLGFRRLRAHREFLAGDVREKRDTLDGLRACSATVDDLGRQLDEIDGTVEFFEGRIPKAKEVDRLLEQFGTLAERHGLATQSFRPLKLDKAGACVEQPMEVTFAGDYPSFVGFLGELERLQRITRVTGLNLSKIADPNKPMQVKMGLSIFYEPESPAAAAASAR